MNVIRRIGPHPHKSNGGKGPIIKTPNASGCPDLLELDTGDIAIIGSRITAEMRDKLPEGASCGADEEVVLFPRQQLIDALGDISSL
jgi:hypothetical protein